MAKKRTTSPSRYALLGFISQEPRSGYDINTYLDQPWLDFWNESYGQIYPNLARLLKDGLVTAEVEERSGRNNGAAKKIYTITEEGEEELAKWMRASGSMTRTVRDEQRLRFLFGGQTNPAIARALIENMIDETREKQEALLAIEHEPRDTFEQLLYELAFETNTTRLEWLEHALETVCEQFGV